MIRHALLALASLSSAPMPSGILPSGILPSAILPFYAETRALGPDAAQVKERVGRVSGIRPSLAELTASPKVESVYATSPQRGAHPFRELLVSWNVDAPPAVAFVVELRVGEKGEDAWSEWMHLGEWGEAPSAPRIVVCEGGKVDVDFFVGERTFAVAQVRVRASSSEPDKTVRIQHVTLCFSDRERAAAPIDAPARRAWGKTLDVPFRSQKVEKPEISGRVCSPTSLAMVLAYHGVSRSTTEVCERAYDAANDIYGNWPRNVQAAYSLGVPGYLTRFSDWTAVEREIEAGNPLILSIAVKKGQLTGAPYQQSSGHLLVLRGFDERGDCIVNDPAAPDAERGQLTYKRAELEEVWMRRGGVTYVLQRP